MTKEESITCAAGGNIERVSDDDIVISYRQNGIAGVITYDDVACRCRCKKTRLITVNGVIAARGYGI